MNDYIEYYDERTQKTIRKKESMEKEPDEWLAFEDVNVQTLLSTKTDAVASITVGPNGPNRKSCENCKHKLTFSTEEPCNVCDDDWSNWEAEDANND